MLCGMPKPLKVVSIEGAQAKIIADDAKGRRVIFSIGSERIAIDLFSRTTRLREQTGDEPAPILPMKKRGSKNPK